MNIEIYNGKDIIDFNNVEKFKIYPINDDYMSLTLHFENGDIEIINDCVTVKSW